VFSSLWAVRMPSWLGSLGVVVGFLGAVIVAFSRGEVDQPASLYWVFAGLCIPLSLAVGNVYRTIAWPENAHPLGLAVGSNLAAAFILFLCLILFSQMENLSQLTSIKTLAIVQVLGSAAMFSVFFRLQQVGGPTYLSQISYVAAAVALFSGTLLLGERYATVTWVGAVIIFLGIGLSVIAQRNR